MLRSFLTVASGYVLTQLCFFINMLWIGLVFFVEFRAFFELDPDSQQRVLTNNPLSATPWPMIIAMLIANAICCIAIGWLVARTSPAANFQHGVFLALLVLVWFLQIVVNDPPAKKRYDMIPMVVLPIAVLVGARWGVVSGERWQDPVDDHHRDGDKTTF